MKHQAHNIYTGEIITATNAKVLQKRVAQFNHLETKYGFRDIANKVVRSWRFSHNGKFTEGK